LKLQSGNAQSTAYAMYYYALQLCQWRFSHTKKLCSRLSSSKVQFYTKKRPFCAFEPHTGA